MSVQARTKLPRALWIAVCALVALAAVGFVVSSPQRTVSVLGELGWRHLVSTDKKVAYINNGFGSDNEFRMAAYTGWSAGIPYSKKMITVGTTEPLQVLIADIAAESPKNASSPQWLDENTFAYVPSYYPVRMVVRVLGVVDGEVRLSIHAEKMPQ